MEELNYIFGVDVEYVFDELRLESLAVLSDILVEVQGQLINDWHSCFYHIENILHVFQHAFIPLDVLEPFNYIG